MSRGLHKANRLKRLEEILLTSPGGVSISELAERLEVHHSTIWRDIQELGQGAPIQEDEGRYSLDRTSYLSSVLLSGGESLVLYLAMRRMIRRTSYAPPAMLTALEKLAVVLRHPLATQLAESVSVMVAEKTEDVDHMKIWEVLTRSWLEEITVRIVYQSLDRAEPGTYEVQPYLFEPVLWSDGVYLIGHSFTHDGLRTFKVERILRATLTAMSFKRPDDIGIDALVRHAWGIWYGEELVDVRLRFSQRVARRVGETEWHPSQHIEELPDGNLEWSVQVAGIVELIPWIRGWGPDCEVLAPPELRRLIAEDTRRAAAQYQS